MKRSDKDGVMDERERGASMGEERGRQAEAPRDIPRRGWRDIALRVKQELSHHHIGIVAAGVAFYVLLSIVPGLIALVSVYGLLANPDDIARLAGSLEGTIPKEATQILQQQLVSIAQRSSAALSLGAAASVAFALWSASKGLKSLMGALNIVYDQRETRGFVRLNATALLLTVGVLVGGLIAIGLVVVFPPIMSAVGLASYTKVAVSLLRWPLLLGLLLFGLPFLYRYGPSRERARWRWVTWGSGIAALLWLVASILFSLYVSNFDSYNKTYGSLGAVVILLVWFDLSAYILLLGGEINAEMEHQTTRDTTTGPPARMGERGATMADTVGETP